VQRRSLSYAAYHAKQFFHQVWRLVTIQLVQLHHFILGMLVPSQENDRLCICLLRVLLLQFFD